MKKLIIISEQKSFYRKPISYDAVFGQEKEFVEYGKDYVDIKYISFLLKGINRVIGKLGMSPLCDSFANRKYENSVILYIAMHINYLKSNIHLLKRLQKNGNKLALYVWDCWETEFDEWKIVLDDLQADYVFFSFKQTYEHFKNDYNCFWIAQSANRYFFKNLNLEKTRMFMQMGRVNSKIHERIIAYLAKKGFVDSNENYVYRRNKNSLLFPELKDLVKEINRTKYLVCIPKCYENPARTGNISAFTGRYYEAIVCKTMIIGKKPLAFDELFPADGMIDFSDDFSDFDEKIDIFEKNDKKYQEIVDKNYECFMNNHTWSHRLDEMMSIINEDIEEREYE